MRIIPFAVSLMFFSTLASADSWDQMRLEQQLRWKEINDQIRHQQLMQEIRQQNRPSYGIRQDLIDDVANPPYSRPYRLRR